MVFQRRTLAKVPEEQFRELLGIRDPLEQPDVEGSNVFALEKYLEDFVVSNFSAIFKGDMDIYEDTKGSGQQYPTDVGPIDILAFETKSKSFVVIELKKGRSSDKVIGQVLRYMGWVKEKLCEPENAVKGLVICRDRDPGLSYALKMIKDVSVRYYNVSFQLADNPYTQ